MINDFNNPAYSTENYYLAASLLAHGMRLDRLDWQDGRASFVFADPEGCEAAAALHWAGDLCVTSKSFTEAMRTLKSRIYEDKNKNKTYDKRLPPQ